VTEQLAIIRNVRIGFHDYYGAALSFTTYVTESSAAAQTLGWEAAKPIVETVDDVRDLEGKPCWVEIDGQMIKFLRLWRP
jgi:hypothetical protein